jgi:hypothetical protein
MQQQTESTLTNSSLIVSQAIENTLDAEGMDAKYPLGLAHFNRPDGSYIENMTTKQIVEMLQTLTWKDITETLSDDCRMGQTRYYQATLPKGTQAYEAAVHFQEYLDLMDVSEAVRNGQEPVPGLAPYVALHRGCQLTSSLLKPQPTSTVVCAVGLSEWKQELKWGSHWHPLNGDPRQDLANAKIFFWVLGRVLPPSSTVKLLRNSNVS